MAYIRIRTNIFEVISENNNTYIVRAIRNKKRSYIISKRMVDGTADNIIDLLDEIVFICGDGVTLNYDLITIEEYEKYYKGEDCCCRGAIWTDRGLKFVSEMNTKTREMELL